VTERHTQRPFSGPDTHDVGRQTRCVPKIVMALLLMSSLFGCNGSPSRNILGSYFPSWMVCALGGLVVGFVARFVLKATGMLTEVPAPLVVLLSIGCATTFGLWLLWLA
jgi:YtcA family